VFLTTFGSLIATFALASPVGPLLAADPSAASGGPPSTLVASGSHTGNDTHGRNRSAVQTIEPAATLAADVGATGPRADGKPGGLSLTVESAVGGGDCRAGGWVYAGAERPVDTFVAPTWLFVRAEPLGQKTGCALREGARVAVDENAVRPSGDRFWLYVSRDSVSHGPDLTVMGSI
jgi:hypothetical protein